MASADAKPASPAAAADPPAGDDAAAADPEPAAPADESTPQQPEKKRGRRKKGEAAAAAAVKTPPPSRKTGPAAERPSRERKTVERYSELAPRVTPAKKSPAIVQVRSPSFSPRSRRARPAP
jgi:protein DEK